MSISHRMAGTRIYRIYKSMKTRCLNPNSKQYKNYGGRGIKICDEWIGENGFMNFYQWAISNGYNDNLTIDRIDVNKGYFPSNCRWIVFEQQAKNRTNSIVLKFYGETISPDELSYKTGISVNTIYNARRRGIVDFTNWKPQKSYIKNITKRKDGKYEVSVNGRYLGRFSTLREAKEIRNINREKFHLVKIVD